MLLQKECVLHVAGGVVGGKVEHGKHVLVVVHLGTVGEGEAHTREDVDDFVLDDSQRVARAKGDGVGSTGEVYMTTAVLGILNLLFQFVYLALYGLLQFVDFHTHRLFLVGGDISEFCHKGGDGAFLAQVFQP